MQGKVTKHRAGVLMLLILAAMSAACGQASYESGKYDADPDCRHMFSQFAESADTVYFLGNMGTGLNDRLWYFDREQMKAMPLCGKAECTHDDSSCNADLAGSLGTGEALAMYGGSLLLAVNTVNEGHVLYSIKPDGTGRKKLRTLAAAGDKYYPDGNRRLIFHRGKAIVYGQKHEVVNGQPVFYHVILSYDLKAEVDPQVILYEKVKDCQFHNLQAAASGNSLYYVISASSSAEGKTDAEIMLYEYSFEGGTSAELFHGESDCAVYEFWTDGSCFLYTSTEDGRVMEIIPGENMIRERMDLDSYPGEFMTMYLAGNAVIGFSFPEIDTIHILIKDFEGNTVYDCTRSRMPYEYGGRTFCGIDDRYFYCNYVDLSGGEQHLIAYPADSGTPVVVW